MNGEWEGGINAWKLGKERCAFVGLLSMISYGSKSCDSEGSDACVPVYQEKSKNLCHPFDLYPIMLNDDDFGQRNPPSILASKPSFSGPLPKTFRRLSLRSIVDDIPQDRSPLDQRLRI